MAWHQKKRSKRTKRTFRYDKNGQLTNVKKGKEENWLIKRGGKRITTLRNNQIYWKAIVNEEGRVTELMN